MAEDLSRAPARNAARVEPPPPVGERGGWAFVWRHRKQLAPLAIAFGLLGISTLGHLVDSGRNLVPLLGLPVVIAMMWRMDRLVERAYAGAVGAAAVLWTQASWEQGIDSLPVLLAWALLTVPAVAIWIHHQQPRSRVEVVGGSVWPWQWQRWHFRRHAKAELERVIEQWPWTAQRAGVPGVTVRRARADIDDPDFELYVDLHGWAIWDLSNVTTQTRIASGLRARVGLTHVTGDDYEHQAVVSWPRDDSWVPVEAEGA